MTSFRIERINKELQRLISEILRLRVKNDHVQRAIVTGVDCSRDLEHAKVFYTTFAPGERREVQKALENTAGFVRGVLGRSMHLRQIPELHFVIDTTEEKAHRIDELLEKIAREERHAEAGAVEDAEEDGDLELEDDEEDGDA